MYLFRHFCCLILLLPALSGCSINQDFSARTNMFLTCMGQMWDYEKKCMCDFYPKGYKKEDYCTQWSTLVLQGYNVSLDIPR